MLRDYHRLTTARNLQEVLIELNRQNKAKQDFISPAQGMRLREDGQTFEINHLTTSQQEVFGTISLFHRQVASALGIPAKYYDLMQKEKPELLAENVNSWSADKPSSYMVRSMDYGAGQVARALLSERYRRIDNMEIATAVLPLFAGNDQYEVMSCEVTENRLYLKVVNHRLEMEVRKGDIVQAGVMISNSEVGLGAVSIQPLVYRLVCTNGMVVNDMGERRHHVGRQAKAVEDSFALYSDETMEAEDKAFLLKLRDTTMAAMRILQRKRRQQLEALGFPVFCVDRPEQIQTAIHALLRWKPGEPIPQGIGANIPEMPEVTLPQGNTQSEEPETRAQDAGEEVMPK